MPSHDQILQLYLKPFLSVFMLQRSKIYFKCPVTATKSEFSLQLYLTSRAYAHSCSSQLLLVLFFYNHKRKKITNLSQSISFQIKITTFSLQNLLSKTSPLFSHCVESLNGRPAISSSVSLHIFLVVCLYRTNINAYISINVFLLFPIFFMILLFE